VMDIAPGEWGEVLRDIPEAAGGAPLLIYGSRAPRWPEAALASSDYDVLVVREGASPQKRTAATASGAHVDLAILSRRALTNSRLMSPQQHVMDRWGERIGNWTWYDATLPISWLGADNAMETLECESEVAIEAEDDAVWLCASGVRTLRRGLTLLYAVGVLGEGAPTWAAIGDRYDLPMDLVRAVRIGAPLASDPRVDGWTTRVGTALRASLEDMRAAVAAYPKNRADVLAEQRLASAHA